MSRPLRIELSGELYHITSRGDRREDIYLSGTDRQQWLEIFGKVCKRFNWICHSYCLMGNHYHMVVEIIEGNLAKGMRQLNGVYTQYFNRTHQRVGHVFHGRYKGILVEEVDVQRPLPIYDTFSFIERRTLPALTENSF